MWNGMCALKICKQRPGDTLSTIAWVKSMRNLLPVLDKIRRHPTSNLLRNKWMASRAGAAQPTQHAFSSSATPT